MKLHTLEIWTGRIGLQKKVDVVQTDSGRILHCIIADMQIPETAKARIYAIKPSKMEIYDDCVIDGNTVKVKLTTQMLAEVGFTFCQIEVNNDGETVTSFEFSLNVKRKLSSGGAIESKDEFTALENALNEVDELKKNGLKGDAATIDVSEVITGEPGAQAEVENVGSRSAALLKFTIPRGEPGPQGPPGQSGGIDNLAEAELEFDSEDALLPDEYTEFPLIESGSKMKTLATRITTMAKNIRYFAKLIGTTDISDMGDKTITGALAVLMQNKLSADDIINNLLSQATDKALSAAMGAQLQNAISELNTKISKIFVVVLSTSEAASIPANGSMQFTTKHTIPEGYVALGIAGVYHSGNQSYITIGKFYIGEAPYTTAGIVLHNSSAGAISCYAVARILCVKTDLY